MSRSDRSLTMPKSLVRAAREQGREGWLDTLPITIATLAERWSLTVGEPFQPGGETAWVGPVRNDVGDEMVLKVGWPHTESIHEAEGLRIWAGRGAIRLYDVAELDEARGLLLEACRPGTPLASRPEQEQDLVISELLPRLWSLPTPGQPFRPLQEMCDLWADEFETEVAVSPSGVDPGLTREGIDLFRSLPATADREVLLCTDLHADNVLAAGREPWLVIDPKPYVGDPTFDPLQHLLNCEERLRADPRGLVTRIAGLLGLDAERLTLWLFARCVQESLDSPRLAVVARRLAP